MKQKGFANILLILAIVAVVGVVGFAALNKKDTKTTLPSNTTNKDSESKESEAVQQTQENQVPSEQSSKEGLVIPGDSFVGIHGGSGAGGSGMPGEVFVEKFCDAQKIKIKEVIYGEQLIISADGQSVLLDGKTTITIAQLPSVISVNSGEAFNATNSKFTSAVLSPGKSNIAFTVFGTKSGWGGIMGLHSGIISPVSVNRDASVDNPKWNDDGHYVVFSKSNLIGTHTLALVNAWEIKPMVSQNEKILDFAKIDLLTFKPATSSTPPANMNIMGPNQFPDLYNYFWRDNKDGKLYLTVSIDDQRNVNADVWSVNSVDLKWEVVCSIGKIASHPTPERGD